MNCLYYLHPLVPILEAALSKWPHSGPGLSGQPRCLGVCKVKCSDIYLSAKSGSKSPEKVRSHHDKIDLKLHMMEKLEVEKIDQLYS